MKIIPIKILLKPIYSYIFYQVLYYTIKNIYGQSWIKRLIKIKMDNYYGTEVVLEEREWILL